MRFVLLVVPSTAIALSMSLAAQQVPSATSNQAPVFRSGASMVALNVTVFDGARPVSGLCREDFQIFEDGVAQQVTFFESRSVPMDIILLLDTSSSMGDKMETVHRAARGFMKMMRPEDRGAVVAFADSVNIVQPLSFDLQAIEEAIESTRAQGSTSLHNAIYIALKQFGRAAKSDGDVRRQAIAVLSDGEDTASVVSFDDVLALARKSGVNIYTIGLQSVAAQLRAAYRSRPLLAGRLRAQVAGAGDGSRVILSKERQRAEKRLRQHRQRDLVAVFDRLFTQQFNRGRPLPADRRPRVHQSRAEAARALRIHGRRPPARRGSAAAVEHTP